MSQPPMTGPQSQGLIAQGPLPAGMLRIQQGNQERYVWPVHLPGWLGLGWRVAGAKAPSVGIAAAETPAPEPALAAASEPEPEVAPESTAGRRKRGRLRKEEQEQPPVAAEANPAVTGADAEQQSEADSDPSAAVDLVTEAAPEPAEDSTADGAVALSALPDDLFSDPLI